MSTLLAVDGNSLFHRAYHAFAPREGGPVMLDTKGRKAWAVSGFLSLLASVIERVGPEAIVIGFDDPEDSSRSARYPDYKATRGEHDADLRAQLARTTELVRALGLVTVTPAGLEADDVVASASAVATREGWHCVVATSDRDSFALVSPSTTVMRLVNGGVSQAVKLTPETLLETVGVRGEHYLDYAALRGDKSDNLPGVPGIGEKTAAKLLAALGSVQAAYDDIDNGGDLTVKAVGRAMAARLGAPGSDARAAHARNRDIMTLVRDVDLGDTLTRGPQLTATDVRAVCARHGLTPSAKLVKVVSKPEAARVRHCVPESAPVDDHQAELFAADEPRDLGNYEETAVRRGTATAPMATLIANPRPARSLLSA